MPIARKDYSTPVLFCGRSMNDPSSITFNSFITAWRYASAVHAVVLFVCLSICPSVRSSVRLSVTSRYCIEMTGQIELVFDRDALFAQCVASKFGISKN